MDDIEVKLPGRPGFRVPLLVLAAVCFAGLAVDTGFALGRHYLPFDPPVARAVQAIDFGPLVLWFQAYSWLAGPRQFLAAVLAIGLVFFVRREASWLMAAGALTGAFYQALNLLIARPRPDSHLIHVVTQMPGSGYPSGHAAFFTSFSVLLLFCLGSGRLPGWGWAAGWLLVLAVVAGACISRIYVGAHWPSDVLGGLFLGTGWTALALAWRRVSDPVFAS